MTTIRWSRNDVETKVMRGKKDDRPDPRTSSVQIFFATDTDEIYFVNEENQWELLDISPTVLPDLTVKTTNNSVTVGAVEEIRVPPGRLSSPSAGVAQIDIPTPPSLRVREQDGNPNVNDVTEIRVSNGTLSDLGSGAVAINIPQPFDLTVRAPSSSPAYNNINTLVVPSYALSQPNPNEAQFAIPPTITVREEDGSPSVSAPTEIVFSNGTVTNPSTGVVLITIPPIKAQYIVAEPSPQLTHEIVIPSWADHPDRANNAPPGASFQQHFDGPSGIVWLGNNVPLSWDENMTYKSHLYVASSGGARYGYWSWEPSGDFDARCKLVYGQTLSSSSVVRFSLRSADDSREIALSLGPSIVAANTRTNTTTNQVTSILSRFLYFRITRVSSTISFWVSDDGRAWINLASSGFAINVARIGISTIAADISFTCDWIWAVG